MNCNHLLVMNTSIHRYLDILQLHEIYTLVETLDDFKSLIDEGFAQANTTIGQIEDAFSSGDIERTQKLSHYLKGAMVTLGFRELTRLLQIIHHTITTPDQVNFTAVLAHTVGQLRDVYDQTVQEFYNADNTTIKPMTLQLIVDKHHEVCHG